MQSVSKTEILAESSIRYPLLEYVERRRPDLTAQLEYKHQTFLRKRCDLLLEDKNDKSVFEFKYVNDRTRNLFQDYFDDILRLHYMSIKGYKSYFIVCGNSFNFNTEFRSVIPKASKILSKKKRSPKGIFSQCLSFNTKNTIKSIKTKGKLNKYYQDFQINYHFIDGSSHPSLLQFETRLVYLKYGLEPQSIGIWEIK